MLKKTEIYHMFNRYFFVLVITLLSFSLAQAEIFYISDKNKKSYFRSSKSFDKKNILTEMPSGSIVYFNKPEKEQWVEIPYTDLNSKKNNTAHFFYSPKIFDEVPSDENPILGLANPDKAVTAFAEPGYKWNDPRADVVGKISDEDSIDYLSTKLVMIYDEDRKEKRAQLFYKIQYKKANSDSWQQAWVDASAVKWYGTNKNPMGFKKRSKKQVEKETISEEERLRCEQDEQRKLIMEYGAKAAEKAKTVLNDIYDVLTKSALERYTEDLGPHMGDCLLKEYNSLRSISEKDNIALKTLAPHWAKKKKDPRIAHPNGMRDVTKEELMAIDTLARTIYGEMAVCYGDSGSSSQFLTGVGKSVALRAYAVNNDPNTASMFGQSDKWPEIANHPITQASLKPEEYSVWNGLTKQAPIVRDPRVKQALCPPAKAGEKFYSGVIACPGGSEKSTMQIDGKEVPCRKGENDIWQTALQDAIQAVLMPNQFAKRTEDFNVLYYTSGVARSQKEYKEADCPSIEGNSLADNPSCMRCWKPKQAVKRNYDCNKLRAIFTNDKACVSPKLKIGGDRKEYNERVKVYENCKQKQKQQYFYERLRCLDQKVANEWNWSWDRE